MRKEIFKITQTQLLSLRNFSALCLIWTEFLITSGFIKIALGKATEPLSLTRRPPIPV